MSTKIKNPGADASPAQIGFIHKLQAERGLAQEVPAGLTKGGASALIDQLMATPKAKPAFVALDQPAPAAAAAPTVPTFTDGELRAISGAFFVEMAEVGEHTADGESALQKISAYLEAVKAAKAAPAPTAAPAPDKPTFTFPSVPEGRYAVYGNDGTLDFYVVERPESGKWAGFTFLSQQLSDDYVAVKVAKTKAAILQKIAQNPLEASKRYGKALGKCGVCHKTLTDPTSIANGIGPVCASKLGA